MGMHASANATVMGREHWAEKNGARLFIWEKKAVTPERRGTILFVHGSSMASTPTFDLQVPGHPDSSAMDHYARLGYDTWTVDFEGYGRSTKHRDMTSTIADGADDLEVTADYMAAHGAGGPLLVYGISSGALRAAMFAERRPDRVKRLALDAFVWTGEGSPTLMERRKKIPEYKAAGRRKIDRAFVHSIFNRDHPGTGDERVIEPFADAILALDDSMPIGTYVDMCENLPLVDPKNVAAPTIIMRGQYDGIAGFDDLLEFFKLLPNPDKQFAVMPGIAHASMQQKNYAIVYHILDSFFAQPEPVYRG